MKISAKQYALGLYEAVQGKNEKEIKAIIDRLILTLAAHNKIFLADKIIEHWYKFYNEEEGVAEAEIASARPLENSVLKDIKAYIVAMTARKQINITTKVEPDLLGGVIIKIGDKVLDGSLRRRLHGLKTKMQE